MFTGLVREIGKVDWLRLESEIIKIKILAPDLHRQGVKLGDSIAINGVCLTVSSLFDNGFEVEAMRETLEKTTLRSWISGLEVNLEPALTLASHLDGHLVTGHVDGKAHIRNIQSDGASKRIELETDPSIARFIAQKGSVALDGVSLTIVEIKPAGGFSVGLIPFTLQHTTLGKVSKGKTVNIEVDIIARYLERLIQNNQKSSDLSMEKILENGF